MRPVLAFAALPLLMLVRGGSLLAQRPDLEIGAIRRDTLVASSTVTSAWRVANSGDQAVDVSPTIHVPSGWAVLMGDAPITLAPRASALLMVSVAVPSRVPAGAYTIRVGLQEGATDSVVVRVPARRALAVTPADRPAYVVSGTDYEAAFLVQNRGNAATALRLSARGSTGLASLSDSVLALGPEEATLVRARVRTPEGITAARDDIVELLVIPSEDGAASVQASVRVTMVPEPGRPLERFVGIPGRLNLRAASSNGVAPFELFGARRVGDTGDMRVDFLFRGPMGAFSPFGERDEYRVQLTTPAWRARLGDNIYAFSPLTGAAQPGLGASLDGRRGAVSGGAYGQQFRRAPTRGTEAGAFVAAHPGGGSRLALNYVTRGDAVLPGSVVSASGGVQRDGLSAELELARSDGAWGAGLARWARVSGSAASFSYDVGHQAADTNFSGPQRGAQHTYVSATAQPTDAVALTLNAGTHRTDLTRMVRSAYVDRLDAGTLAATFQGRYTLELGSVRRGTTMLGIDRNGRQHGVRARVDQATGFGAFAVESEVGRASESGLGARAYSSVSLSGRRALGRNTMGLWIERYSGGSVVKGSAGTLTLGADAALPIGRSSEVAVMAYASRVRGMDPRWYSQADVSVARTLRNGSRVSLRARGFSGGAMTVEDRRVAFLEYSLPLSVPVSRLRTPGRVRGRVVDATTGAGIAGALVRLGPQVGITDRDGRVTFGGVPAGEHRLSLSQETSFANSVFVGDPEVVIDSARRSPTVFQVAVAHSARVDVAARRYAAVRTAIGEAADSLLDAGPLGNATFAIAGERDTLYRTTSEDGRLVFTDIPPGRWVVFARDESPAFQQFEPDRMEIVLTPGESRSLAFRLVPRRRQVQLIGAGQELRATPADPAAQPAPSAGVRTGRPYQQHEQDHKKE